VLLSLTVGRRISSQRKETTAGGKPLLCILYGVHLSSLVFCLSNGEVGIVKWEKWFWFGEEKRWTAYACPTDENGEDG
jgi:hypothetical protein